MTLKEYLQKYYTNINDYAGIIDDTGDYSILHELFFPNYGILNTTRLNEINYSPFIYENTPYSNNYYGGRIVYDISEYIGENYYDNNVNERFFKRPQSPELQNWTPIMHKIFTIMIRYKYKWHGLYETMLLDGQYDPLDNVNEIYDETITREPDLTYTDSNSTTYGQQTRNQTDVHGAQSESGSVVHGGQNVETTNTHGAQSETLTDNFGSKTTTQNNEYGAHVDSDSATETTYPFDSASNSYPTAGNNATHSFGNREDELSTTESAREDTHGRSTTQYIDSSETESASYTDSTSTARTGYTDTSQVTDSQHVDSASGTKTESGTEETTITRRRHGNIGVTTSGQLIEDYRKTHYFDIVKIIANDIINEIFDLNFAS